MKLFTDIPVMALLMLDQDYSFPGLSTIADTDGRIVVHMGSEEGVIVAEVILDHFRKYTESPPCFGRWAYEYDYQPLPAMKGVHQPTRL